MRHGRTWTSLASTVLIGAGLTAGTYIGLTRLFGKTPEKVDVVEKVSREVDSSISSYQNSLQGVIQSRQQLDAALPKKELEKLIADEVSSLAPSALKPIDIARIVKYAADNNTLNVEGNRYAALKFYENFVQQGGK